MRFAIHLFIIMIAYLLGGSIQFPDNAQNVIFQTPFFMGFTAVYCIYMVVYCLKYGWSKKKIFFQFMHIGVAVIVLGAGIGAITGQSSTFSIPIDEAQLFDEVPIEETYVGLGFDISVSEFVVEKYDPVYELYRIETDSETGVFVKEAYLRSGSYDFGEYGVYTEDELKDANTFVEEKFTDDGHVLRKYEKDKEYRATLIFSNNGENSVEKVLRVNHPVQYGNWKFYLMSYDEMGMEYVTLEAKADRGVPLVIFGIWVTIIATFGHCILINDGQKSIST